MREKVKVSIKIYDMQGEGIHVFAPAFVSGLPINMLIDTGASKTIFDLNFIREKLSHLVLTQADEIAHGLSPGDNTLFTVTMPDVYFNAVCLKSPDVRLLDLTHVNNLYKQLGITTIQGIIGSDWLYYCKAIIDFSTSKLKLKIPVPEPEDAPEIITVFDTE